MARKISPLGEFVLDENVKEPFYDKIINWLSAMVLLSIVLLVFFDAMGRYFYKPITGAAEIVSLLLGVLIFSAFPLVTRDQQHICVGLLDHLFAGKIKWLRDFVVLIASTAFVAFMGWRLWALAWIYIGEGRVEELTGIPRAPVAFLLSGLCFFTVILLFGVIFKFLTGAGANPEAPTGEPTDTPASS